MKNMILEPLSFYPKRSGAYKYSGFSVFRKKTCFFKFGSDGFSGGAREGPETCVWRPRNFQGGSWESESGPRGPCLEGPGSTKVHQGWILEGKTGPILRFLFFALNDSWKVPRGSQERGAEQQEFHKGAEEVDQFHFGGPKGVPKRKGTLK